MADTFTVNVAPGALNTTLAPTALDAGQARDLLNCDTGQGDWRLDLRHRRFASPPALGVPSGLLYANHAGSEEWAAVSAPGSYAVPGAKAATAYGAGGGANLAPKDLLAGMWRLWAFDGRVFYTLPAGGVWSRPVGGGPMEPLYRDVESPGSSGDATALVDKAWRNLVPFDPNVDAVVWKRNGGATVANTGSVTETAGTGFLNVAGTLIFGKPKIKALEAWSWVEAEITLSAVTKAKGADSMVVVLRSLSGLQDGYGSGNARNQLVLTNSTGTASAALFPSIVGRLDSSGGTYYAWYDLSGVSPTIKEDVKKVALRFGVRAHIDEDVWVDTLAFGGVRYRDTAWGPAATVAGTADTTYAYNVTEGATVGNARKLVVTGAALLGDRVGTGGAFAGATVTIRVPKGDAPFTGAATINLYRLKGGTYYKVATAPNDDELLWTDILQDSEVVP